MHVQSLRRKAIGAARPLPPNASWRPHSKLRKALASARLPAVAAVLFAALVTATCSPDNPKPIDVSVRDVVIDPYAVDGKLVRLIGVLHRSPAGDVLYWHLEDVEQANENHGVVVQLASAWPEGAERHGAYVAVEGIFRADHDQAGSDFNGALLDARNAELR